MEFLVDENSSASDKFLEEHPNYKNVKYHLEQGIKDETILRHSDKSQFIIVTKDTEFALDALIAGFKVWYHDEQKSEDSFLTVNEFDPSKINGFVNFMLKKNNL